MHLRTDGREAKLKGLGRGGVRRHRDEGLEMKGGRRGVGGLHRIRRASWPGGQSQGGYRVKVAPPLWERLASEPAWGLSLRERFTPRTSSSGLHLGRASCHSNIPTKVSKGIKGQATSSGRRSQGPDSSPYQVAARGEMGVSPGLWLSIPIY